jgi:hypothetical protein
MAWQAADAGDDGTNDLLVSDVIRRNELQVWFLPNTSSTPPSCRRFPEGFAGNRRARIRDPCGGFDDTPVYGSQHPGLVTILRVSLKGACGY